MGDEPRPIRLFVGIFGIGAVKAYEYRQRQVHGPIPTSHGYVMAYTDTYGLSSDLRHPYNNINSAIIIFDGKDKSAYGQIGEYIVKIRQERGEIPVVIVENNDGFSLENNPCDSIVDKGSYLRISMENDYNILSPTEFLAKRVSGVEELRFELDS